MHVVCIWSNRYGPVKASHLSAGFLPGMELQSWGWGVACFALLSAYLVSVGESPCGTHWCFCEDRWWRSLLHRHTGHLESLSGGRACIRFFFFNWVVCLFWLPGERCLCGPDASPWGVHVLPISSPALWLTFWLNSLFRSADILHFNGVQGSDHLLCGYTLCVLFKGCLSVWRSYRWPPALSLEAVLRYFSLVWARGQGSSFSLWLFTPFVDFTPPGGKCVVNLQITVDTFSCQTGEVLDPELRFPLLLLVFYISISSTISLSIWQSSFSFFLAVCLSVSLTHTHTFWHFDMDHIESISHFGENWQHIPYWVFQSINTEWISWFPLLKSC